LLMSKCVVVRDAPWSTRCPYTTLFRSRAVTLEPERTELALVAARAVGADYAGVDLLPARDGTVYVVEVNGIPGWRGLQEATSLEDRKSTRLNSSHVAISYAVFGLKKKT